MQVNIFFKKVCYELDPLQVPASTNLFPSFLLNPNVTPNILAAIFMMSLLDLWDIVKEECLRV